jgi:hypothetical protein
MPINENAPLIVVPGAIRFNTDSMKLEYYRGGPVGFGTTTTTGEWVNLTTDSPDIQTGGARGLWAGGNNPALFGGAYNGTNTIDYITISSTGNAIDFGDRTVAVYNVQALGSSTRGVFATGFLNPGLTNVIDFVTFSSTGNATDFGDKITPAEAGASCSSSTRGIFAGGSVPGSQSNAIEYITIAATGNSVDFGDLTQGKSTFSACASSTRGVFGGGQTPTSLNTIDFITISTLGNAADFGDLTVIRAYCGGCSNSIRGIFAGGLAPSPAPNTLINTIDYITISTLGNAVDFGDFSALRFDTGSCASSTRGVFGGGNSPDLPTRVNTIDYVTIMSIGNAVDFGDLTVIRNSITSGACSNGHGGLG